MNLTPFRRLAAAGLAGLLLAPAAQAGVTFSDDTLDPASFSALMFATDPSVTITATGLAAGGNPDAALQVRYVNDGSQPNLLSTQGFLHNGWTWDPAVRGALGSVDFGYDRYTAFGDVLDVLLTTFTRVLVSQGGRTYLATLPDPQARRTWVSTSGTGLTADDFVGFDFTTGATDAGAHPDFGAGGAAMDFGFASRLTLQLNGPFALDGEYRFDNLRIALNDAQAVPEPATALLAAAALAFAGRRRARPLSRAAAA